MSAKCNTSSWLAITLAVVMAAMAMIMITTSAVSAQMNSGQDVLIFADDLGNGAVQITLQSSVESAGWIALGVNPTGPTMQGSDIVVAFFDPESRNVTLSRRVGAGHTKPAAATMQDIELDEENSGDMNGTLQVTFVRAYAANSSNEVGIKVDGTTQYFIWAYGDTKVTPDDDAGYALLPHLPTHTGSVAGNLMNPYNSFLNPIDDEENHMDLLTKIHGGLMFLAWGVFAPLGIILARFFKNMMGVWWFRAHVALLFIGAGGCTIASFVIIYYVSAPDHFIYEENGIHVVLGLALFIAILVQIVQGFVIDRLFNPMRTKIPWWDQLHWWFGRLIIVGCWVNIVTGLYLYEFNGASVNVNWTMVFVLWMVFIVISYLLLQFFFKQTHHLADTTELGPKEDEAPAAVEGKGKEPVEVAVESDE